jgi:hypothetical protein
MSPIAPAAVVPKTASELRSGGIVGSRRRGNIEVRLPPQRVAVTGVPEQWYCSRSFGDSNLAQRKTRPIQKGGLFLVPGPLPQGPLRYRPSLPSGGRSAPSIRAALRRPAVPAVGLRTSDVQHAPASGDSASCSFQRAQVASDAQTAMVGMSKEQVLACMGPPMNKAAEGATEVWSYASGNGETDVAAGRGWAVASKRFCTVNVTMASGRVSRINYVGPSGGLLTGGEQCAYVISNCLQYQHTAGL